MAAIIERINALEDPMVVAIDVPSGLDADSGCVEGTAVRADRSITFLAEKTGYGNKAAQELMGYEKGELIGKNFFKLKLLPADQIKSATTLLAKNALGKPTGPDEFTLRSKDGTLVPVDIRTHPVKIENKSWFSVLRVIFPNANT